MKNNLKKQTIMKKYILAGLLICIANLLCAQAVDTAHFRLRYTPTLKPSQKINQHPSLKDTTSEKVNFDYFIVPQRYDVTFKPTSIGFNKVAPEGLKMMYRNYLKVGFGYPVTPLLDFSFHNLQNTKNSFGANVHHFSSWANPIGKTMKQYAPHPTSDTRVHLNYKHFFKSQTLYSAINYNHEASRLYGFKVAPDVEYPKDSLKNNFHHLNAMVGIASNYVLEEKKLKQDVRLNYDFLRTNWKDMENHVGLNSFFAYDARWTKISGSQLYRLNLDLDYFNNKWADLDKSANAFLFNPEAYAHFTIKEYHILVGVGGIVNAYRGKADGTAYPIAELQLGVIPNILNIYAGVNGDCHYNSYKDMLYENPFMKPQLDTICFTTNYINIYGGVKGNLVKKLNYNISAHYSYAKNLAFFMLDTLSEKKNQFDVYYQNGNVLNVCLNMDYEILRNLHINFDANYWLYALKKDTLDEVRSTPLYKPWLTVGFKGTYVLKEKFVFGLNFDLEFGRKALAFDEEVNHYTIQNMKPMLDFGIDFEYLINDHFSAFAMVNNIACQHYEKYYDFKCFGINALVGVKYAFGNESLKRTKKGKSK